MGPPFGPWWGGGGSWGPPWGRRRGVARRFGCLFVLLILFAASAGGFGLWTIGTSFGFIGAPEHIRILAAVGLVIGLLVVLSIGRAVGRMAAPVDELVGAAGSVESGDYSVRVAERGSSELRSLARAFNSMSARLQETDRLRRTYLADVTHELRTPLAVIQGQLEAVLDGVYPADASHLAPILEATRTLDGLIDDLRTLTLVETGSLTLDREPTDLALLVNDAIGSFRAAADLAKVTLTADLPIELPAVDVDPVRIRSVLSNLLANALRHTPEGGRVAVRARAEAGRTGFASVAVTDTGPGIPEKLLPRVFDRFVKGPGSEGSGLGLAIARDLVAAHGGTITARNEPGNGTTVEFSLPVAV